MTNPKRLLLLFCMLPVLLSGCQSAVEPGDDSGNAPYVVAASFSTMADFAGKIGGERVEVFSLVPAGAEPHDWEPSAKDIARLEAADMLVTSGAGFEHWVDGVVPTLSNTGLTVVEAAKGIELLEGSDHGGHHHEADPHVWLDPANAEAQMGAIRDALSAADPGGEPVYQENFGRYSGMLRELDAEFENILSPLPGKDIVVAHEAFGYLCHAYGLHQVAVQGLSPEGEPEPGQMASVVEYARENTVKVIFFEEAASPKVAEAIAREVGARTDVLNPLESLTQEQLDAGEDYFSIMRRNLAALEAALS